MTRGPGRDEAPRIDPETLAALMEGRLSDDERARVLALLSESDEDLEILADAAAVMGELEADALPTGESHGVAEGGAAPSPDDPEAGSATRGFHLSWRVGLPIAAVLAAVALIPTLRPGAPAPASMEWLGAELALLTESASVSGLPELAWTDPSRSGGTGDGELLDSLGTVARAFREGVLMARLGALPMAQRSATPEYRGLQALLGRSTAGTAAAPALEGWAETEETEGRSWAGTAQILASVEGQPAAFRLGTLAARTSLVLGLDGASAAAEQDVVPAMQSLLTELPEDARAALDASFRSLVSTLESPSADEAARAEAIDAFIEAAANLRPPQPVP